MKSQRRPTFILLISLCGMLLGLFLPTGAQAQTPMVQVVLFYSPFCGHCQRVIGEDLPPIVQAYNSSYFWSYFGDPPDEETGQLPPIVAFEGDVLQILYVDTTTEVGGELYTANAAQFQLAPEDQVVPIMVVGDQLLIGGIEIPEQLPGLIDSWLAQGGLSWPAIPGLEEKVTGLIPFPDQALEAPTPETDAAGVEPPTPEAEQPESDPTFALDVSKLSVLERIQLDPLGNSLAIVVLIGMLFSLIAALIRWRLADPQYDPGPLPSSILVLTLLGIAVSGYLAYVATTGTDAVCGPVGDCHTVQTSEYASIFGSIPNGMLGLFAYLGMLVAWIMARRIPGTADSASLALFGLSLLGTAFSAYLTFLEPFVIGATCMWCVSSAIIITIIMLLSAKRARFALAQWRS